MPMLWVFRRDSRVKNRTGWYHVADESLAEKLIADGMAARRFDPRKKIETAPRIVPRAEPAEAPRAKLPPADKAPPPDDPPPPKARKAKQ